MKRAIILTLVLLGAMALTRSAGATTLSYTDSSLVPGDLITYTLDFSLLSGHTYGATFSVTNSASKTPDWYAGWFLFKFDGSTGSPVSSLTAPAGSGPWSLLNSTTYILSGGGNYSKLPPNGGFTGFYATSLSKGHTPDITDGILLDGAPKTSTFTFDFTVPTGHTANTTLMPFQVGYYDKRNGSCNIIVNRLSQDLSGGGQVPEPGTLMLVGTGLVGLWSYRRIKKG